MRYSLTENVGLLGDAGLEDLLGGAHDAEVDDLEVVAPEDDGDDVLADVVDVALHGGQDDGAAVAGLEDEGIDVTKLNLRAQIDPKTARETYVSQMSADKEWVKKGRQRPLIELFP